MNKMWEPEFDDWSEGKVTMFPGELPTSSMSRGEYGVMMQLGMCDDSIPIDAAIFWTDEMHLYLRYDWGAWYKVSTDDPDNCSNICKRNSAKLLLCTTTSIKHHAIKVYHIDSLPEELFGKQENKPSDGVKATQLDFDFHMPLDAEIQTVVDIEIEKYDGKVLSRVRPENNTLYSFDFAQIGAKFYIIVYAEFDGTWLADDNPAAHDPPLWFSDTENRVSPVFQAVKCRTFFAQELPQIDIEPIVVLPEKCIVINDEEERLRWCETHGTAVVRTQRVGESVLQTLREYLKTKVAKGINIPELDAAGVSEISNRFTTNPENWINKN